jgi:hypothetical protein
MRTQIFIAVLCATAMVTIGCSKKDGEAGGEAPKAAAGGTCEALIDKLIECSDEKPSDSEKKEFLEKCEKNKDNDRFKAMMTCTSESSCGAFEKCTEKKREEARLAEELKELKEKPEDGQYTCERLLKDSDTKDNEDVKAACAVVHETLGAAKLAEIKKEADGGNASSAIRSCGYALKDEVLAANEALKTYCDKLPGDVVKALTKTVTELRDGGKKVEFKVCYDLEQIAEKTGEEAGKAAKTLCREAKSAEKIAATLEKIKEELRTDSPSYVYDCDYRMKDLQKLDSEWAKKAMAPLTKACFQDLGKVLLTKTKDQRWCGSTEKKIIEGLDKYPTDDAELKALVEAAKSGRCAPK